MHKIFVSYSHEDQEHDKWVMNLARLLRENGVDANLDKWDLVPGQDTTFFMESQIRDSDFVILICTPIYCEKSNIPRGGVGYEKNIISAEMLQASDLRPKFIPVLRKGSFDESLPSYLGSKYAIDFRDSRSQKDALYELLRAIYKQPHPEKPPLGPNPFDNDKPMIVAPSTEDPIVEQASIFIQQDQDIDLWENESLGRFKYLCEKQLNREKENPFSNGYWHASFVLYSKLQITSLKEFLEKLRASKTGRTGWDVGWVPTRAGIAPYPYKNGIEVWLAEDGDKGPAHSDFWRAEQTGRFALIRGHEEDEEEFRNRYNFSERIIDFSLCLWRISEVLLYLESFSNQMSVKDSKATLRVTWRGLENRRIGYHKDHRSYSHHICRQDEAISTLEIKKCSEIKKHLLEYVELLTIPLFETFNFFSVKLEDIGYIIKDLFDPTKENV